MCSYRIFLSQNLLFYCRVYNAVSTEPSFVLLVLHVISIPLTGKHCKLTSWLRFDHRSMAGITVYFAVCGIAIADTREKK